MPLCHITPQTEHATPASAGAGNVGKECGEEQAERRDYSVVCCLLRIRATPRWVGGVSVKTHSHWLVPQPKTSEVTSSCSCVVCSGYWGHPPLITEHHAFIMRQRDSSPSTATQAAGISPAAFCFLCSCELSLYPPFCNGVSTCGEKILFLPQLPFKWEDACLEWCLLGGIMLEYWNQKVPHGDTAVVKEENWRKWSDLGGQPLKEKNEKRKREN